MAKGFPDSFALTAALKLKNGLNKGFASKSKNLTVGFSYKFQKLKIYDAALNKELHLYGGVTWKYMERLGRRMVAGAKRQVGVKTGALRASIHMKHLGNASGQYLWIGSQKSYAYYHHEGTRPHTITPKEPGGALVFRKGSRIIRTPVVNHPGTRPNRYLSDQLRVHITR